MGSVHGLRGVDGRSGQCGRRDGARRRMSFHFFAQYSKKVTRQQTKEEYEECHAGVIQVLKKDNSSFLKQKKKKKKK